MRAGRANEPLLDHGVEAWPTPLLNGAYRDRIRACTAPLIVYSVMRNEMVRLRGWLAHYRRIGCTQFFVVDNGSSDGTYEELSNQPDVIALQTQASFREACYGVAWLNEFRAAAGEGRWVLFADADELLVYPGWPERGLASLVGAIEAEGADALWAFMLDMYPDGPIEPVDPEIGADLFRLAPCFDATYHFQYPPRRPGQKSITQLEIIGGPRLRMLSTAKRELAATWVHRTLRNQIDRVINLTPDPLLPLVFRLFPQALPGLFKTPLVRCRDGVSYINNHTVTEAKFFRCNAIICHFKFLGDFSKKVHTEIVRKQHYRKSAEYFRYLRMLKRRRELDLRCADTVTFESVAQFEKLGLFTEKPVWPAPRMTTSP
jgi:hypothetical protein